MQKKIIRNISRKERFFEIINSMPSPVMNLYSQKLHNKVEANTIGEAYNKGGICLYRFISQVSSSNFESVFKALKKELNA